MNAWGRAIPCMLGKKVADCIFCKGKLTWRMISATGNAVSMVRWE